MANVSSLQYASRARSSHALRPGGIVGRIAEA